MALAHEGGGQTEPLWPGLSFGPSRQLSMTPCIVPFFCLCNKTPLSKINLEKRALILAYGCKERVQNGRRHGRQQEQGAKRSHLQPHSDKQHMGVFREDGSGISYMISKSVPSSELPPAKLQLLQIP